MKKIVVLITTIILLSLETQFVSAQARDIPIRAQQARTQLTVRSNDESSGSGRVDEVKNELIERRKENVERVSQQRERVLQKQEEVEEKVQEARENQIARIAQNHSARLTRRFGFYYLRLSGLIDKIQFRLDTFAAASRDVSQAQETLNQASQMLEDANQSAQEVIAEFDSLAESEGSSAELSRQAAKLAQDAQAEFVDVVLQLRLVIRQVNQDNSNATTNME